MIGLVSVIFFGGLTGCDRNANDLIPEVSDLYPAVIEIGELEVVDKDTLNFFSDRQRGDLASVRSDLDATTPLFMGDDDRGPDGDGVPTGYEVPECPELQEEWNGLTARERHQWYLDHGTLDCSTFKSDPDKDHNGDVQPYYFGQLGRAPHLTQGGATFTFIGTGDNVCVIVDPETVYWNQSIAPASRSDQYAYPDFFNDDGDLDLYGGMSSYYTGSPGVEIGDFKGFYTDSKGELIEIEYGECNQSGYNGVDGAHAGRGTSEFCTINTDQQEGVEFTVVMETWSVPLDDGVLSFGVTVMNERCPRVDTSECFMLNESLEDDGSPRYCTDKLEQAQCNGRLGDFCCANPTMCGDVDNVEDRLCQSLFSGYTADLDEEPEDGDEDPEPTNLTRQQWCDAKDPNVPPWKEEGYDDKDENGRPFKDCIDDPERTGPCPTYDNERFPWLLGKSDNPACCETDVVIEVEGSTGGSGPSPF